MDFLTHILFESPLWLGAIAFVAFAAVLLARQRLSEGRGRYAMPAVLAATALLFAVQWLVVTQRERILDALDAFVAAIEAKDAGRIAGALGADYLEEGMDREAFLAFIASALQAVDVYDSRYGARELTIEGDRADMVLAAAATVRVRSEPGQRHAGRWRIGWTREQDRWVIISVRPVVIDTLEIGSLRALSGYLR